MQGYRQSRRHRGFTMIELMITVALVAILSAIALPTYRQYILRAHRSDALSILSQDQATLERCYAQNFSYLTVCSALPTFPQTSPQAYYSIALSSQTATTYTLTATPINSQNRDTTCSTISVDQANQRVGLDSGGTAQSLCWNP
jgi:type IV pilus assembly protein PilE